MVQSVQGGGIGKIISDLMKDINSNFMGSSANNNMESFDPESAIK